MTPAVRRDIFYPLFQAQNIAPKGNPLSRIAAKIHDVVFGYFHRLVSKQVLISQNRHLDPASVKRSKTVLESMGGKTIHFAASDGTLLEGMHLKGKQCTEHSQTIALFSGTMWHYEEYGNGVSFDFTPWLDAGYNVFIFNYRGVGNSQGVVTRRGLILDGEAVVQLLHDHFKVPIDQITLHGYSLGGGIAAEVTKNYPNVNFCNDRSFTSLSNQVRGMYRSWLIGNLAASAIKLLGWELDTSKQWPQIKGRKFILTLEKDHIIPKEASFARFFAHAVDKPVMITLKQIEPWSDHIRGYTAEEVVQYVTALQAS